MSIQEVMKLQREILDKIYPPAVQQFINTQKRVKLITDAIKPTLTFNSFLETGSDWLSKLHSPAFDSMTSSEILKLNARFPSIFNYAQFSEPAFNVKYWAGISALTGIDVPNRTIRALAYKMPLLCADYDLSQLLIENDETEEADEEQPVAKKLDVYIDESLKLKRIITDVYHDNSRLLTIDPREFEELVAELLRKDGFEVELTKKTRDGGYDLIALQKVAGTPLKFLVECKRHSKKIGVDIIRSFKSVIADEGANVGMIATTSYFTRDAKNNCKPYLLDFRDRDYILEWLQKYYLQHC